MIQINWGEFKEYKKYSHEKDNFLVLLNFLKSYYNMFSTLDIYDVLVNDDTALLMLEKRKITSPELLEDYIFGRKS